ncbi:MAG TPA: tetratricopeptide repeat protein, partial [Streptosporangiaceae bacterium]|nr:tetratricopeptide repeat protein [Streptosporangiaceae bacterium]
MEPESTVLDSLRRAVEAMPDEIPLRVHLATLLLSAGQRDEAIRHVGAVLQRDPGNTAALDLLREGPTPAEAAEETDFSAERSVARPGSASPAEARGDAAAGGRPPQYDWSQAEDELRDVLPARFVGEGDAADSAAPGLDAADAYDAEHAGLT